jgi:hypothetical protein
VVRNRATKVLAALPFLLTDIPHRFVCTHLSASQLLHCKHGGCGRAVKIIFGTSLPQTQQHFYNFKTYNKRDARSCGTGGLKLQVDEQDWLVSFDILNK